MWRVGSLIVCLLEASAAEASAPPRVSVEISPSPAYRVDGAPLARLKELLSARLSQEGFTVVSPEVSHDVALGLAFGEHGWTIRAAMPTVSLEREVSGCGISLAEDQLEIVQKATELVRKAAVRATEPAAPPTVREGAPQTIPEQSSVAAIAEQRADPTTPTRAPEIELSTAVDLLIRGIRVDPMVRVGGRLGLQRKIGLHVTTGLSRSSDGGIDVLEGQALVGLGYRVLAAGRFTVEGAAAAGLLFHHYASALDAGDRIDELALLVVTGAIRLSQHVGLTLRVAPGLSRTEYVQLVGNEVAWTRSRFRIESGIGLVFQ